LLDLLTDDPVWGTWSEIQIADVSKRGTIMINDIIWAECSVGFSRIEDFSKVILGMGLQRVQIPTEALFLAGKAFLNYRRSGGAKSSPLPDFFIGAHAAVSGLVVMTRDSRRMRTHYPRLNFIEP
jgi:predicted nucleic acid-binding protein